MSFPGNASGGAMPRPSGVFRPRIVKRPSRRGTARVAGLLAALACSSQPSGGSGEPPGPITPSLAFASPSADVTATSGVVHVEVRVEGEAQVVQLLVDGGTLTSLRAPFRYDWDTSAMPEASYELRAELVSGGKTYESAPKTIVVDRTRPEPPRIDPLVCAASATSIALVGTAERNATVAVYEGSTELAAVPASGAGNWRLDVALGAGSHVLLATARDAAGNVSDAWTRSVTVDASLSLVPEPPTLTRSLPAITNFPSLWVQGIAQTGNTVYLYWDEREATRENHLAPGHLEVTARDGTWGTFVDVSQGTHVFTATQRNGAGCESRPTAPQTVVDDTTAPGAPRILSSVPPIVNKAGPATFPVNGTAEARSTVRVYVGSTWVVAQASDGGEWAVTVQTSDLPEGSDLLKATAQDPAGNTSPEATTAAMLVDRIAPAAPRDFQGLPAIVNIGGPATFTARGTAEALSTVMLSQGSTSLGSTQASASGAWSIQVTTAALAEGTYGLTATATDGAGNTSSQGATPTQMLVDRRAPSAPTFSQVPTVVNAASSTVTVSGTAEAQSTVRLYRGATLLGTATAAGGAWSLSFTASTLPNGSYPLSATTMDTAGNTSSTATSASILVDRTVPSAPTLTVPDTGKVNEPFLASGTAEASSTVRVYEVVGETRELLAQVVAAADGSWSVGLTLASAGSHTFTATAMDGAGNVSSESATATISLTQ